MLKQSQPQAIFWRPQTWWQRRDLLLQLSRRKITDEIKGSSLGLWWIALKPILLLGVYTVVFGFIMGSRFRTDASSPMEFPLGLFLGLALVSLVNETLTATNQAVVNHPNLVKKVVFPVEILPLASLAPIALRFAVSLVLCLVGLIWMGAPVFYGIAWLVLIIPPLFMMACGLAWAGSAIGVYVRDSQHIADFFAHILFYSSGVFYSSSIIPESIYSWIRLNPLIHAVEVSRLALIWGEPPPLDRLLYVWIAGVIALFLGTLVFQRLRPGFADEL